jgi:hypothetical protein
VDVDDDCAYHSGDLNIPKSQLSRNKLSLYTSKKGNTGNIREEKNKTKQKGRKNKNKNKNKRS